MNWKHVKAVFLAEYYTTTYRFRNIRKFMPAIFLLGIFLFGYILRTLYDFVSGEIEIVVPSINILFAALSLFSYFTLFAPLLSIRVIYDDDAKSRREVALSAPLSGKDMLTGNLLSNLAFYLPFFGLLGTLVLSPFVGNGNYSPFITSVLLFLVLSMLITVGLVAGTLISPIIFSLIARQKSETAKAVVTLLISAMMITSLPLLKYLMDNIGVGTEVNFITILPFTVAASLIVNILYGVSVGVGPLIGVILLIGYNAIVLYLGWKSATKLYSLNDDAIKVQNINPNSKKQKLLNIVTSIIPKQYREITRSMLKASFRDVEHISRLSIGLAVTIFMIFALSSQGLFRGTQQFSEEIELAVVIFSLVLSSASVIFIEASSFTIQHRDIYSLIKSSPSGARKFVIAKTIQMLYITIPIFVSILIVLGNLGFISNVNRPVVMYLVIIILLSMITETLAIYMIHPADNIEDISNFINLLFFYTTSFILATIPVVSIILNKGDVPTSFLLIYTISLLLISLGSILIAIKALEEMNLETLSSIFSIKIITMFKTVLFFLILMNFMPLLAIQYLTKTNNIFGFTILSSLLSILIPLIIWIRSKSLRPIITIRKEDVKTTLLVIIVMFAFLLIVSLTLSTTVSGDTPNAFEILKIPQKWVVLVILFLVIIEELIFRSFLFTYALRGMGWKYTVILTSLLFSVGHLLSILTFVNALIQGMLLGYLRYKTNNVTAPIFAHFIFNMTIVLLI